MQFTHSLKAPGFNFESAWFQPRKRLVSTLASAWFQPLNLKCARYPGFKLLLSHTCNLYRYNAEKKKFRALPKPGQSPVQAKAMAGPMVEIAVLKKLAHTNVIRLYNVVDDPASPIVSLARVG
jgi:hypothetical protein